MPCALPRAAGRTLENQDPGRFVTPDIDKVASLIRAAAAEHILPFFEKLEAGQIEEKGPGDLVTIADLRTEQALTPLLRDLMPEFRGHSTELRSSGDTVPNSPPRYSRRFAFRGTEPVLES
jgi:3'-phosphoadenosine 5'-phosphosulfate (PAPS) 3'-phosphatase